MTTKMAIPAQGRSKQDIESALADYRARDVPWRTGKVFGYVFDSKHEAVELGKKAYGQFMSENGLDPTSFPSLLRLENEVVRMCATHVHGDADVVGNFSSGGTESIILAVKTARDRARALRPEITRPEMLVPITAHAAFHKAAHYLDVTLVPFDVSPETFRADALDARRKVTESTIMLVGSAPSYAHGVIDPIEDLAALARERDLWLHVDGCMGGLLLPYLERLGYEVPRFDFRVEGVSSLSMDLHKYGYCPKGASVVLYRNRSLRRYQIYACSEWTGYTIVNATVQSTKSGGPVAGAWATMQRMGDDGYMQIAKDVKEATDRFVAGIDAIPGLRVMGKPEMALIAFTSDEIDVFHLPDLMKKRGWYIQPQLGYGGHRENVHLTVAHTNTEHVDTFLADLRACVDEARGMPSYAEMASSIAGGVKDLDPTQLDESAFLALLGTAGMSGVGVPDETASLNRILQAIPRKLTKEILVHYLNHLFS